MDDLKQDSPETKIYPGKAAYAEELMKQGYMCSAAVVAAFGRELGLDPALAARISSGLAAGMAQEKTCGAVTGAVLVIGLKYGTGRFADDFSRDLCAQMVQEFFHRFTIRRKSVGCKKIHRTYLDDSASPNKLGSRREKLAFCTKIVRDAAEILEALLAENV